MFDINSKAHIELTAKLGRLHKSALPVAVRQTLNDVAFETKRLIPQNAAKKFVTRDKRFFKTFSSVQKAKGFNIDNMKSTVGINPAKGSKVAEGLEQQEKGGIIKGRKLIPHDMARVEGSHSRKIKRINRFENVSYVKSRPSSNRSRKSNTVAQAIIAAKTGKLMFRKKQGGKAGIYFRVKSIRLMGTGKTRGVSFKMTPIFIKRNTGITKVKSSPFMKPSSEKAFKNMPIIYKKQAERQIKRLLK